MRRWIDRADAGLHFHHATRAGIRRGQDLVEALRCHRGGRPIEEQKGA
jgi:hypothetical protein